MAKVRPLRFANTPKNLRLVKPFEVTQPQRIFLGDDVHIGRYSILKPVTKTSALMKHPEGKHNNQTFDPVIRIGNRVSATGSLQLVALQEVTIEDDVMLASNVFICDGLHGYEHANLPYKYQGHFKIAPIRIKQGSWIGQNVVIMPGVTIGELSIVGANSVVTKDIPDRCIAVGAPARVVKTWDEASQAWVAVKGTAERKPAPTHLYVTR